MLGGHHCQTEEQSYRAWLPPLILPELAAGPEEAVAVSMGIQSTLSAMLRTEATEAIFPEQQGHPVANPSERDGDTTVRQLRSGRTKPQATSQPLLDHPPRPSQLHCQQHLVQETALGYPKLRSPLPTMRLLP